MSKTPPPLPPKRPLTAGSSQALFVDDAVRRYWVYTLAAGATRGVALQLVRDPDVLGDKDAEAAARRLYGAAHRLVPPMAFGECEPDEARIECHEALTIAHEMLPKIAPATLPDSLLRRQVHLASIIVDGCKQVLEMLTQGPRTLEREQWLTQKVLRMGLVASLLHARLLGAGSPYDLAKIDLAW
jgi:hypothetical protein